MISFVITKGKDVSYIKIGCNIVRKVWLCFLCIVSHIGTVITSKPCSFLIQMKKEEKKKESFKKFFIQKTPAVSPPKVCFV